jgi:hypothetical protein
VNLTKELFMSGDCHLDPPDPAKQIDASKPLTVHDCQSPPPGSKPEAAAAAPEPPQPLINRVVDWAASLLPASAADSQAARNQALDQQKLDHIKFEQQLVSESKAQRVLQNEAFSAFNAHPDLFPTNDSRIDAYHALMRGYKIPNIPEPNKPLTDEQQTFVDKFGWSHSKDTPNEFRNANPDFAWTYMNWHQN